MCVICSYRDLGDLCKDITYLDDICEHVDYIPGDLINLETLILEGGYDNNITISNKLVKLNYISCISSAQLSYIPDTLINLTHLNCIGTGLTHIPSTLINLIHLDCSYNNIIELPNTLVNLTYLDCSNNKIIEIPDALINLTYLNCSENKLDKLPDTLIQLVKLKIRNNAFECLPETFINLEHLNISNSSILKIPKTFIKLKKLVMLFDDDSYYENQEWFYILFISLKKLINLESIIGLSFTDSNLIRFAFSSDEIVNYINTGIIIYGLYFSETVKLYHYKKYTRKNLLKYVELITDKYLNPKSPFVDYMCKNLLEKRGNEIGYINSNNELKIFKLKK